MQYHILHVTNVEYDEEGGLDDYAYTIECPTQRCGFIECDEGEHNYVCEECAADGYECGDCDPGEEYEFHGVMHEFHWGYNWTVPYDGCAVADAAGDSVTDIIYAVGGGDWRVDSDWVEDYCCYLTLIGPVLKEEK